MTQVNHIIHTQPNTNHNINTSNAGNSFTVPVEKTDCMENGGENRQNTGEVDGKFWNHGENDDQNHGTAEQRVSDEFGADVAGGL